MDNTLLIPLVKQAKAILIFTGAGISTSTGIADYRGPDGVWKTKDPVDFDDFMRHEAARIEYWNQKLEVWPTIRDAEPSPTHRAIVDLEQAGKIATVVTQNIDGLHDRAGSAADRLIELHGSNLKVECMSCHRLSDPEPHFATFATTRKPPLCDACSGFLKPATISFGQALNQESLMLAAKATNECDLVIALGSTLSVHPAATIPLAAAKRGIPYVIINRGTTDQDHESCVTLRLEGDVNEIFPAAVRSALS